MQESSKSPKGNLSFKQSQIYNFGPKILNKKFKKIINKNDISTVLKYHLQIFKCVLSPLAVDGGTCLSGHSDIFIHCSTNSSVRLGNFEEWSTPRKCLAEMGC